MQGLAVKRFEPVYLELGTPKLTEYGKGWLERRAAAFEMFHSTLKDVLKLAVVELWDWEKTLDRLQLEGCPVAISSGLSQYQAPLLINATTKEATYTAPAAFYCALATAAPTSTTTGSTITEAAYTGYARVSSASVMGAASAATPSVATNSGGAITFGACTGGTSTLLGFMFLDASSAGNGIYYGTLTSVTISTTNTPPTVASSALSLSWNGV
jgi:hypothetical protein